VQSTSESPKSDPPTKDADLNSSTRHRDKALEAL